MTVSQWLNWILSVIVTAVQWLKSITLFNVPVLYIIIAIPIIGTVIGAILYRVK